MPFVFMLILLFGMWWAFPKMTLLACSLVLGTVFGSMAWALAAMCNAGFITWEAYTGFVAIATLSHFFLGLIKK